MALVTSGVTQLFLKGPDSNYFRLVAISSLLELFNSTVAVSDKAAIDNTCSRLNNRSLSLEPITVTVLGKRIIADVIKDLETGRLSRII